MSSEQEQQSRQLTTRRHVAPMPPDNVIRQSIAASLTQILVNMTDAETQRQCQEILEVSDLAHGAHVKILAALEHIDERRKPQRPRPRRN
ncbi:uncharacterized protein LOC108605979 [Drosophila busckii]|uniref:uncharacterized protein LOC108605979 n=1 Tax=Drosophila busckii TaxID=30019 RepID=UPI00083F24E0|nr:uncharacterized protein LOC108605979 [Drosophila busckii]